MVKTIPYVRNGNQFDNVGLGRGKANIFRLSC